MATSPTQPTTATGRLCLQGLPPRVKLGVRFSAPVEMRSVGNPRGDAGGLIYLSCLKNSAADLSVRISGVLLPLTDVHERFVERSERRFFASRSCCAERAVFQHNWPIAVRRGRQKSDLYATFGPSHLAARVDCKEDTRQGPRAANHVARSPRSTRCEVALPRVGGTVGHTILRCPVSRFAAEPRGCAAPALP
jgi:hypothetical protein